MSKLSFHDFNIGDAVFHLSNENIKMVVVEMIDNVDNFQIKCRWIDNSGSRHLESFLPEELDKF